MNFLYYLQSTTPTANESDILWYNPNTRLLKVSVGSETYTWESAVLSKNEVYIFEGNRYIWTRIVLMAVSIVNTKVSKDGTKVLSTNEYTTIDKAEVAKVATKMNKLYNGNKYDVTALFSLGSLGFDLSDANLSGADFYGADLSSVNFYGSNLSGVILLGANLYAADLSSSCPISETNSYS